jgi:hypothetical protein
LQSGLGYWSYFPNGGSASVLQGASAVVSDPLPSGQFVLIGNPGNTVATVSGADIVLTWNGGQYTQAGELNPGQGAWALSESGGQALITSSPL